MDNSFWAWMAEHWQGLSNLLAIPLTYIVARWKVRRALMTDADRTAVVTFLARLPPDTAIKDFFHDLDLRAPFSTGVLDKFMAAIDSTLSNPISSFHNKGLRKDLTEVQTCCAQLRRLIGSETFPAPLAATGMPRQTVRRSKFGDAQDDWETAEKLNNLATDVYEAHLRFLNHAKKALIGFDVPKSRPVGE
jgi:hypothetical protein